MRHEKNLPASLVPVDQQPAASAALVAHVVTHAGLEPVPGAARAKPGDVCAELFKFCKQCDEKYLHPRKIQCLFDVDGGTMNRAALRIVCGVIETLLEDISEGGARHFRGASLTVTLRRHYGVWILALTERRIAPLHKAAAVRRRSLVQRHAQLLGAACRVQATAEGFITALMFDCAVFASEWRGSENPSAIH